MFYCVEKTVAAHKTQECVDPGTIQFMNIIISWWKILNIKSKFSGKVLLDPFRHLTITKTLFFWNIFFSGWNVGHSLKLMKSTGSYSSKLSKETNFSLKHTTLALLKLTKYLLDKKVLQYVLLGKFQNDDIESRFGQYRQMSGGNYNITV